MKSVDQLLRSLFKKPGSNKATTTVQKQPLHTEVIKRTTQFSEQYNQWLNGGTASHILNRIHQHFALYDNTSQNDKLAFLQLPNATGLLIYPEMGLDQINMQFLLDNFMQRCKSLGYVINYNFRNIHQRAKHFEVVERYYLKPKLSHEDFTSKRKQIYGNILLELHSKDEQPQYLKLLVTTFTDANYHNALPFEDLIEHLCTEV